MGKREVLSSLERISFSELCLWEKAEQFYQFMDEMASYGWDVKMEHGSYFSTITAVNGRGRKLVYEVEALVHF